ncbi:MAG: preprotein translocase subunit SecY [Armatimonadota bacterium]
MLEKLTAAMAVPDIRKRVQYVLAIFLVYIAALHVPAAGINHDAMDRLVRSGLLNALDIFSGGALKKFSIIGLSITPYINASIIMQLMTVAIPQLKAMQQEGESGRKQINKITRYASIGLAIVQAIGLCNVLVSNGALQRNFFVLATVVVTLTAGTMFLLWLGEQITEKGIGNGISLIIFVGIMVSIPAQVAQTITAVREGAVPVLGVVAIIAMFVASIVGIIYMTQGVRRIPVQHMRKVVGNRMTQGGSSFLPLKVNTAGVIPIIFAMSIQLFPQTLTQFFQPGTAFGDMLKSATEWLTPGYRDPRFGFLPGIAASLFFTVLVLFFTYFYTAIQYDTSDIADNLKKHGSFIPGFRPGKPTAEYLDRVLTRITFAGAVFLAVVSLLQYWAPVITQVPTFSYVGGTSLLIVVGVALETMQGIEAQMAMRNYEGFIKMRPDDSDNMMRARR